MGDYQALAGCITEGLQTTPSRSAGDPGGLVYHTVLRPDAKRVLVTGMLFVTHGSPTPMIDLTFQQMEPGTVTIDSRWGGSLTGRGDAARVDRRVWALAERCAGRPLEIAPPIAR